MLSTLLAIVGRSDGNFYFDGPVNGIGEGLIYALIGFLVVFVGIILIIFIIWLLGLIMKKTDNLAFLTKKREKGVKKGKKAEKPAENNSAAAVDGDIPDEIKVAITAAILAYYEQNSLQCEFKVKRIKRI